MPVVALDGEYVAVFKFNDKIETEIFASQRALFDRFSAVRAELESRPDSADSPRLAALVATLTDEFIGREPQDYGPAAELLNKTLYGEPDNKDGGSPPKFDKISKPEPGPSTPGISAPWKGLEDDARSAAIRHVSRYYSDDYYRACVDEELVAVTRAFNGVAVPADHPAASADNLPSSCNDGPILPNEAPKLWINRTEDDPSNPSAFIRKIWEKWLPHALARQDLKSYDLPLYTAYAQWIRPDRHPNDTVDFAPKRPPANKLDDNEFVVRKRKANAAAQARRRAALRSSGPEQS